VVEIMVAVDLRLLGVVLVGLLAFGYGYNSWVAALEENGRHRGYVSFLVVLGVAVTGAGFALAVGSWEVGLVLLACFAASGLPMVGGSVGRYIRERERQERDMLGRVREGLESE
jgi:hypothetical protein